MIRVMAVDDEIPALKMAESLLGTFDDVHIIGLYTDPDELLNDLSGLSWEAVDVVLADIRMPGMHGLELAGRIEEVSPDVSVVFVTAYDDYAVDAYETDALDYIMKPMTAERMRKALDRHINRKGGNDKVRSRGVSVRSFGRFSVEARQGKPLKFRRSKTEELLTFLLHHRGQSVAKDKIMDALWSDRDLERATGIMYTTMYQLRKELEAFGLQEAIEQSRTGGGFCRLLWIPDDWDCDRFEQAYRRYKSEGDLASARRAVELYGNGYLTENGYGWAAERQAELELQCAELLEGIADDEVRRQRYEFALPHLQRWEELLPYTKRVHDKIIALYVLMNHEEAATAHERKVRDLFAGELGLSADINMRMLTLNPWSAFESIHDG